jgi:UDP-N-acetylmuramoyl-L-alanyl-D-glutamate--2,6-diaminopimelate ligase
MSAMLSELPAAGIRGRLLGADVSVSGVRRDSREVTPGDLFVALPGDRADAIEHVADAIRRGAVAVMASHPIEADVPVFVAEDVSRGLGLAAEVVHGRPLSNLVAVGITGTNGKTTCVHLLESVFAGAGRASAVVGTGYLRAPGIDRRTPFTTPFGDELSRFARDSVEAGAKHLFMEVSSHGLALHRVDAVRFDVAAFTNLTQDHLDFHASMQEYGDAKARLFVDHAPRVSVLNVDDPFGRALASRAAGEVVRVSTHGDVEAEVRALSHTGTRTGLEAEVEAFGERFVLRSPLIGLFNLENVLVVLGCALALGVDRDSVLATLAVAKGAPGRLERVEHPGDVTVLVDYAHTPDALTRVLEGLRPITPGRLLVVFGCGGDRDRGKRPEMGRAAARVADVCVVTSDNPRTESPSAILDQIVPGLREVGGESLSEAEVRSASRGYIVVEDRAAAIALAIAAARDGDTVVLAGKGHEDYQIIGTEKRPFDDREQARKAIGASGGSWRP